MSHRLLRTRSLAVSSLVLIAAGGIIAAACGSNEKEPGVSGEPLMPGGGNPGVANAGAGGGSSAEPGDSLSNTNGGTSSTNEGQGGSTLLDSNPGDNSPSAGTGGNAELDSPPLELPDDVTANCNPPEGAVPSLTLQLVADGLDQPLHAKQAPGDDTRLFVVEKGGRVRVILNGELLEAPFIDVSQQLVNAGEAGLLGLAFHPDYATNGLFYLHFSSNGGQGLPPQGDTAIAEFTVSADRSVADPASRRVVLTIDQPQTNHNGGEIAFGPDGMLYFGAGDGGGGNDQGNGHAPNIGNGQSLNTLLGKMLRIDPLGRSVNDAYGIPAGNLAEVTGQQALPEIWAYGLRNPWRYSFDACTGDLYIGDVGQLAFEEIDFLAASRETRTIAAGVNFGWRLMEGVNCRPGDTNCNAQSQAGLVLPVDSYPRDVGTSVTGGYVYRGSDVPGLRGNYIYADYNSARFFRFRMQDGQIAERVEITDEMRPSGGGQFAGISSFGTDNAGEMYVTAFTPGAVYRVAAAE